MSVAQAMAAVRLDEYDKMEWRDVARRLRHDWTEADFEREWMKFVAWKRKRTQH